MFQSSFREGGLGLSRVNQVLHVDDDADYLRYVLEFFETVRIHNDRCQVESLKSFDEGMAELAKHRYDLLILDVFRGDPSTNHKKGVDVFDDIRKRRFLPTVFLTARANDILGLQSPVVKIVSKAGNWQGALQTSIVEFEGARVFRLTQILYEHVDKVTRDFMWQFFPEAKHYELLREEPEVAGYLLARSIGCSLDTVGAGTVAREVAGKPATKSGVHDHPAMMYVPPLLNLDDVRAGDIRRLGEEWIVVLTPSCDLVERTGGSSPKSKLVLCARCFSGSAFKPISAMKANGELEDGKKATANAVLRILEGRGGGKYREDQIFYMPKAFGCPGLVVDLEDLVCVRYEQVREAPLSARLDSPYVEALGNRFSRFIGRVGVPAIDFEGALK